MSKPCPSCKPVPSGFVSSNDVALACDDNFPVSPGHALAIPKRHVGSWFDLTGEERNAVLELLDRLRERVIEIHKPAAFNIGINDGAAAGQTVPHVHVHLIPRYEGDQRDARGGVRRIFPDKAAYWERK